MPRPVLFTFLAALLAGGCNSSQVALGGPDAACDYDQQCDPAQGLTCECVVTASPDDEGGDQIIRHGFCSKHGVACPGNDGGADAPDADAADATDTAADTAADAAADAAADTATDAAADTATDTATDAAADTATDAAADAAPDAADAADDTTDAASSDADAADSG